VNKIKGLKHIYDGDIDRHNSIKKTILEGKVDVKRGREDQE